MSNTEGNELIAKYQGAKIEQWYSEIKDYEQTGKHAEYPKEGIYPDNQRYHPVDCLKYHKDWNWIIPVVKKVIQELKDIQKSIPGMGDAPEVGDIKVLIASIELKLLELEIEPLWKATVQAIKYIQEHEQDKNTA